MKRILFTLSLAVLAGTMAFGQHRADNDPSYSVHNYKHPDKAAYAKKHKLDKSTTIVTNTTRQNDNYKQSFSKPETTEKAVIKTRRSKSNKSYKHPYGL